VGCLIDGFLHLQPENTDTYSILPQQAVRSIWTELCSILEVTGHKTASNDGSIAVTTHNRHLETLKISRELLTNRHRTRQCFEVKPVLVTPLCRLAALLCECRIY
jgi:hypothetical protein